MKYHLMPSTVVASFSYDHESQTLKVVFRSGMVYDYINVPREKYEEMRNAFSKGSYLNTEIKGKYRYRKVG